MDPELRAKQEQWSADVLQDRAIVWGGTLARLRKIQVTARQVRDRFDDAHAEAVWRSLEKYDWARNQPYGVYRSWIITATVRVLIDMHDREARQRRLAAADWDALADRATPAQNDLLIQVLQELPDQNRSLWLLYNELRLIEEDGHTILDHDDTGPTLADLANQVGGSAPTMHKRLRLVAHQIRQALVDRGLDLPDLI